jgi:hypothetical protein
LPVLMSFVFWRSDTWFILLLGRLHPDLPRICNARAKSVFPPFAAPFLGNGMNAASLRQIQSRQEPPMRSPFSPPRPRRLALLIPAGLAAATLAGCQMDLGGGHQSTVHMTSTAQASELDNVKRTSEVSTVKLAPVPTISATGYAVISSQPGKTLNQRRLMAIRVARMDAMRALTEQIHGLIVESETKLSENVLQSDVMRTAVSGAIRGARTVRIEPKGSDTYSVALEIDRDTIAQILKSARRL